MSVRGVFLSAYLGDVLETQDRCESLARELEPYDAWTARQLRAAYESLFNALVRIERLQAGDTGPE